MEHVVRFPMEIRQYGGKAPYVGVNAWLPEEQIADWCLQLCLLDMGLIDGIVIENERPEPFRMALRLSPVLVGRGWVQWQDTPPSLLIDTGRTGYIQHFFWCYYRDGAGDVDHCDVDVSSMSSDIGVGLHMQHYVPKVKPGMTREEFMAREGITEADLEEARRYLDEYPEWPNPPASN
jgi:hypothetical protein